MSIIDQLEAIPFCTSNPLKHNIAYQQRASDARFPFWKKFQNDSSFGLESELIRYHYGINISELELDLELSGIVRHCREHSHLI